MSEYKGIYNVQKANLDQVKAAVAAFGTIYFHGDGNIFTKKDDSDFRKEFSNPDAENSKVRVAFGPNDRIPTTVQEMDTLLRANASRERQADKAKEAAGGKSSISTFAVPVDPKEPAGPTAAELAAKELSEKAFELSQRESQLRDDTAAKAASLSEKHAALDAKHSELESKMAQIQDKMAELAKLEAKLKKAPAADKS